MVVCTHPWHMGQHHCKPLHSLSSGRENRQPKVEMQREKTVLWFETVSNPFLVFHAIYMYMLGAVCVVQCM